MTELARPPAAVQPGTWILMFGSAVEVLAVEDSKVFECARQLMLRTLDGAVTTTLVPLDFLPVTIDWAVSGAPPRP